MTEATPEFRALFDKAMQQVLPKMRVIIGKGEQHAPMMMLFDKEGGIRAARLLEFNSNEDKDVVAQTHRDMARVEYLGCAMLVTESWVLRAPPEGELPKYTGSMEHVPGRSEALMVSARKDDMHLFAIYPIERPASGETKGSTLGEPIIADTNDPKAATAGRFVDPPRYTTH